MEAAVFMGLLFGALTCGNLYQLTSAWAVFLCSTICTFIALVWIFLFVKESIKNETEQTTKMVNTKFPTQQFQLLILFNKKYVF